MPGPAIDNSGFNVMRVSGSPWFIVFNPDPQAQGNPQAAGQHLAVGNQFTVGVDPLLVVAKALPGAAATPFSGTMLQLRLAPGNPPSSYQIVLQPGVWPTAQATYAWPGYRTALLADFDGLLRAAEKLESSTLQPGAAEALRALLAARIPATYAESLYFSYGVFSQANPPRGYFDVRPGMRLAVEFEERQYVPPTAGTGLFSGFVGGATASADVISRGGPSGTPQLGLDAFFSVVRLPPIPPAAGGAGGIIDLVSATAGLRHLRVCYPAQSFPGADEGGRAGPASNVTLLGAPDLATLASATNAYYSSGAAGANLIGWFRGRTVIRACVPLLVNGSQLRYVPVGSTLRHLLEQFWVVPRLTGIVAGGASPDPVNYLRPTPGVGLSQLYGDEAYSQLTLAGGDGIDSTGADVMDFPVLAGDVLPLPKSLPDPGSGS